MGGRFPWLTAMLFLGAVLMDDTGVCLAALLAAAVHECGHLLAAELLSIPLRALHLDHTGMRLEVAGGLLSYGEEWLLCAAGPLSSLLGAAVLAPLWGSSSFCRLFSCASLLLGGLNLLPISTFDGGRMLECTLNHLCSASFSRIVMRSVSFLFLFLLWASAVYFLLRAGDGLSLFAFSMSLFFPFFNTFEEG